MDSAISLSYAAFIVLSSSHSCSSQETGGLKGFPGAPSPGREARASQMATHLWAGGHCLLDVPRASLSRTQAQLQELCHCDPVSAVAPTCPAILVQQGWGWGTQTGKCICGRSSLWCQGMSCQHLPPWLNYEQLSPGTSIHCFTPRIYHSTWQILESE